MGGSSSKKKDKRSTKAKNNFGFANKIIPLTSTDIITTPPQTPRASEDDINQKTKSTTLPRASEDDINKKTESTPPSPQQPNISWSNDTQEVIHRKLSTLQREFFEETVSRPTHISSSFFQQQLKDASEHASLHLYDSFKGPEIKRPKCKHPFTLSYDLQKCDSCYGDLGAARAELEKQGSLKVIQEDTLRSSCTNDIKGKPSKHARLLLGFGVSIQWLLAFTYAHNCWKYPTWKIVKDIIKPATKSQDHCRFAELKDVKPFTGKATVFMSHCWGSKWGDLVMAACHGARKDRIVWIDIFAVRQWAGNVADLDFRGVIQQCVSLIVAVSLRRQLVTGNEDDESDDDEDDSDSDDSDDYGDSDDEEEYGSSMKAVSIFISFYVG